MSYITIYFQGIIDCTSNISRLLTDRFLEIISEESKCSNGTALVQLVPNDTFSPSEAIDDDETTIVYDADQV